jgi:hypothetical protein
MQFVILERQTASGEASAKDAAIERIERLEKGLSTATGWKRVIVDFDHRTCVRPMRLSIAN